MSRDLELQLDEMGPAYREVVGRLRAAYAPSGRARIAFSGRDALGLRLRRACALGSGRVRGWLVAASLLVIAGAGVIFRAGPVRSGDSARSAYALAYLADDSAVEEIVRSQNPDGSWANDFLTRQNAAVLRGRASTRVAYKRAVRYLRMRGLCPLSDAELKSRGDRAARGEVRG